MATYDYRCSKCLKTEEFVHGMLETPEIRCPSCDIKMEKIIGTAQFRIHGGTEASHWKEKRSRLQHSDVLAKRQKERYGDQMKAAPNVMGHRTDTWADAQKLAKECSIPTDSYVPWVAKEKSPMKVGLYTGKDSAT